MHPATFFDRVIEHHGMIRWILKRYTGWDDNQMYQAEVP
jgi:hypothetical protein